MRKWQRSDQTASILFLSCKTPSTPSTPSCWLRTVSTDSWQAERRILWGAVGAQGTLVQTQRKPRRSLDELGIHDHQLAALGPLDLLAGEVQGGKALAVLLHRRHLGLSQGPHHCPGQTAVGRPGVGEAGDVAMASQDVAVEEIGGEAASAVHIHKEGLRVARLCAEVEALDLLHRHIGSLVPLVLPPSKVSSAT